MNRTGSESHQRSNALTLSNTSVTVASCPDDGHCLRSTSSPILLGMTANVMFPSPEVRSCTFV